MLRKNWLTNKSVLALVWIVAIAIRLYAATFKPQLYDMATFEAWSRSVWQHPLPDFFNKVWSDYLPLPILSFAPISLLADALNLSFSMTFKYFHIFIELLAIYFVYKKSPKASFLAVFLLLFSPALIADNAFWGQVDVIPSLLGLLALLYNSPILLGLAVAYKPIMVLIAPILWIISIKQTGKWYHFPLVSALVFFVSGIPTGGFNFAQHLFARIFDQAGTYPYLTINAFNLWSLVPNMMWISDTTSILSISGHTFGLLLFIIFSFLTLNSWHKTKFDPRYGPRVAATILITFFAFTTRMHERHLLFGLPFLALASAFESWLIVPFLLLSLTFTLNLYGAYYWVFHNQVWPFSVTAISLTSWLTILTTLFLIFVWSWPKFHEFLKKSISSNLILVLILSIATFLRTVNLAYPPNYIFDEVYHAFTAKEYLNNHIAAWQWWTTPPAGVAYEWTHPPLAKYGMVIGMLLFGQNSFGWRIGSATAGVVSIYGLYLLVLSLTNNKNVALLSAFLLSIEGLHLAQSRIAMNDMYLMVFYIFSLYCSVKSRWKLSAILYGLALSSKWSALYGVIPLAYLYVYQHKKLFSNFKITMYYVLSAIRYLAISLVVYVLSFTPFILAGHTWAQWWELHRQMWYYHTHLVATHAYQSTPLEWIFDARPVWYYVKYLGAKVSHIYVIGNPLLLWFGLASLIISFKHIFKHPYTLFYLLYIIFTLPWVFSPRIMFFYHYLPSASFLMIHLSAWIMNEQKKYLSFYLTIFLLSLIIISPMLYGLPMSSVYWTQFFKFIPSWK